MNGPGQLPAARPACLGRRSLLSAAGRPSGRDDPARLDLASGGCAKLPSRPRPGLSALEAAHAPEMRPTRSWAPALQSLCVAALLLAGGCPPPTEGLLCPAGVKYWDEKRAKCRPCTVCPTRDFPLYPCEVHRDTICASLSSVIELLVEREEGAAPALDWSAELIVGRDEGRNSSGGSVVPLASTRPLAAREGHVLVLASAVAVMLMCAIVMIAIGVHLRRRKRMVALIENEEILDRLSLHGGRFSMTGRFHPTDQMKYLVDLDHSLAMDRILEQRQRQQATQAGTSPNSIPHPPHNVYVDHLILVNTPQRDVT